MRQTGTADLPLHGGRVPPWLATRMAKMGRALAEIIVLEYGREVFLQKLSDPFWFQSMGCLMGMDWHSSGITTSVVGALKRALNPIAHELGLYVCGGRGKHSRQTPMELEKLGHTLGQNPLPWIRSSKLSAKVDNTAVQDGYQLYLHAFFLSHNGHWAVVQQGMNNNNAMARRYHWCSDHMTSFVDNPHTAICGRHTGNILNLANKKAVHNRQGVLELCQQPALKLIREMRHLAMPRHHDVQVDDVHMRRLGSVVALAQENQCKNFEELLLTPGLGPRTMRSLALTSELVYGAPARFSDPARFSFAHGGKDGYPFPVPLKVYDQTIATLNDIIHKTKIDRSEKKEAFGRLHTLSKRIEQNFTPDPSRYNDLIENEWKHKSLYGGRTVMDDPPKPVNLSQLSLF